MSHIEHRNENIINVIALKHIANTNSISAYKKISKKKSYYFIIRPLILDNILINMIEKNRYRYNSLLSHHGFKTTKLPNVELNKTIKSRNLDKI